MFRKIIRLSGLYSNLIFIVEFFSYWAIADIRAPKRGSIFAIFLIDTFNKMYFIINTEYNTTKRVFTR